MKSTGQFALVVLGILCYVPTTQAVTIDTVPVGNAGNAGEVQSDGTFGGVAYNYRIGTYEVTNSQYSEFLNAKAASDPLALYNLNMGSGHGGITRSGLSPNYSYAPITGRENMPVNYVSWYDAIRFANWLHNGQGAADTETGAYTLLGRTPVPSNGPSITRNAGATWALTSEDEWYKAAYHKNDGVTGNYFGSPTISNTPPMAEAPPGGSNSANCSSAVGDLTNVGAYDSSKSPYGTFDQAGNLWELNEALVSGSFRGLRGGSWSYSEDDVLSSVRIYDGFFLPIESGLIGFRVVNVPEPATFVIAALGLLGVIAGCRRFSS